MKEEGDEIRDFAIDGLFEALSLSAIHSPSSHMCVWKMRGEGESACVIRYLWDEKLKKKIEK